MKNSLRTVLVFCGVVALAWWRAPAIGVAYHGALAHRTFRWCAQNDTFPGLDPLPSSATFVTMDWSPNWPHPERARFTVPVRGTRAAALRLAEIRRAWLTLAALQASLLALMLLRHRQVVDRAGHLAAQLKRRLPWPVILTLIILPILIPLSLTLFRFSWFAFNPNCFSLMMPPELMIRDQESLAIFLAEVRALLPAFATPTAFQLNGVFAQFTWASIAICLLLLAISWFPRRGIGQETTGAADA